MGFQLVRAGDTEIAVWHVDHGHIFSFAVSGDGRGLRPGPFREAPDAERPAAAFRQDALAFATAEARSRRLIG